jgi:hypothetical protein
VCWFKEDIDGAQGGRRDASLSFFVTKSMLPVNSFFSTALPRIVY